MPDQDGISYQFPNGGTYCHGCGKWIKTKEVKLHRSFCGSIWRKMKREG